MAKTFLKIKTVPKNARFWKQLITMVLMFLTNCFQSTNNDTYNCTLTFHNFFSWNLKVRYLVIFSSYFIFWSPGNALSMILHFLFSLSTMSITYLPALQSSKMFYISHSPALAVWRVSFCICLQLGQSTNWKNGRHFELSPCRSCIEGTRPSDQCHLYCAFSESLFLGCTFKAVSVPFHLIYF